MDDTTTPAAAPAAATNDLTAIDWDRRLREDRLIGAKYLAAPYERDKAGQVVGYEGPMEFQEILYVPIVKCGDGVVRAMSTVAMLERGTKISHEGNTARGNRFGGKEDITPLSGNAQIASTLGQLATLFGHPMAGAAVGSLVAAGGSIGGMPVSELVSKLQLLFGK